MTEADKQAEIDRLIALAAEVNRTANVAQNSAKVSKDTTVGKLYPDMAISYAMQLARQDNFDAAVKYNTVYQQAVNNKLLDFGYAGISKVEEYITDWNYTRDTVHKVPPFPTSLKPPGTVDTSLKPFFCPFPAPNPVTGDPLIPTPVIDAAIARASDPLLPPTGTVMDTGNGVRPRPPKTTTAPVFVSSATFKAGTDKAANARGAKALADAAKKAANAAKLSSKQSKQLMNNVANAIKNNTTSGKKPLAKPKPPRSAGGKPISRPKGSSTGPVTGGGFPLPNGGAGQLPPGAVSSPSPGCFKDASGNTFCV